MVTTLGSVNSKCSCEFNQNLVNCFVYAAFLLLENNERFSIFNLLVFLMKKSDKIFICSRDTGVPTELGGGDHPQERGQGVRLRGGVLLLSSHPRHAPPHPVRARCLPLHHLHRHRLQGKDPFHSKSLRIGEKLYRVSLKKSGIYVLSFSNLAENICSYVKLNLNVGQPSKLF